MANGNGTQALPIQLNALTERHQYLKSRIQQLQAELVVASREVSDIEAIITAANVLRNGRPKDESVDRSGS